MIIPTVYHTKVGKKFLPVIAVVVVTFTHASTISFQPLESQHKTSLETIHGY